MRKRLSIIAVVGLLMFSLAASCASINPGTLRDYVLDANESAALSVVVGLAMGASPEIVQPAYDISGAMIALLSADPATLEDIRAAVKEQVEAIGLTPGEAQSLVEIFNLLWAQVDSEFGITKGLTDQKIIYVIAVLNVVHNCAAARME